ncbi:MAG: T9SS type A sorting domain-containing protein [Bacteroidetes bacterium]|nr:T9SS type A sorting domain-containing protein [Bacteroidota bacterium]
MKGKNGNLLVYDLQGKAFTRSHSEYKNGYYTRDLSMIGRADGVYLVVIETEQERLVKKVLID